jgi:uncharacterized membrane protein
MLTAANTTDLRAAPGLPAPRKTRRAFIDLARGFAVLCMVEHHSLDAWMPDSFHGSELDHFMRFLGGVAAPAFLFLAGVAMVLMMEGALQKTGSVREAALGAAKRGLWIFIGAYLFRVQEWALAFGASPASTILRIDVLNCIGLALMLTALVWSLGKRRIARAVLFFIAAAAVVLVSPLIWASPLTRLPPLLFNYVRGSPPMALFPIFPWIAYSFAGALVGLHLAHTRASANPARAERNALALWLFLATPAWFFVNFIDALPFHLYAGGLEWWRTSPAYFLLRCISMIWLLAASWLIEQAWQPVRSKMSWKRPGPLVALGQHSLVIYWVHIEIVYGRLMWPWRGRMTLPQASRCLALLFVAMIALAYLVDPATDALLLGLRKAWSRRPVRRAPAPVADLAP